MRPLHKKLKQIMARVGEKVADPWIKWLFALRGILYMYKNILSDNRSSFTTENLAKYVVVNSFFKI